MNVAEIDVFGVQKKLYKLSRGGGEFGQNLKEQQLFSGNLPLPQKALSNVICKFLHIHAIVLYLIHRPVLVLTWGNLSNRKKHWASISRGVAFDVILHFCSEATSETPDVCRPLVEVANKC